MAHKLDGTWHSYVVVKLSGGTSSAMADDDFIMNVRVNESTGRIETGSHNGKPISGSIISVGSAFAVSFEHELSTNFNSRYEGAMVNDDAGHGVIIMSGTKRRVPKLIQTSEKENRTVSEAEDDVDSGQEDGTWVATKP